MQRELVCILMLLLLLMLVLLLLPITPQHAPDRAWRRRFGGFIPREAAASPCSEVTPAPPPSVLIRRWQRHLGASPCVRRGD